MESKESWVGATNADYARIGLEALNNLRRVLRPIGDELHDVNFGEKKAASIDTWDLMRVARNLLDAVDTVTMMCRREEGARIRTKDDYENWPF